MGISSGVGDVLAPVSYGFRNVIINGNFSINQRVYASGTNLASGSYGFDRWKSTFTNTALTFTSAPQGQLVTISSGGSIEQVVERANVPAGSYVLSWSGTARGRVYNSGSTPPAYAASPVFVTLDGTANVEVEFAPASGTATLGEVQLERGQRQTPFEFRPVGVELALCQRYYEKSYSNTVAPGTNTLKGAVYSSTTSDGFSNGTYTLKFAVEKRAVPDITFYTSGGTAGSWSYVRSGVGDSNSTMYWTSDWSGTTGGLVFGAIGASYTAHRFIGHWVAVAEL